MGVKRRIRITIKSQSAVLIRGRLIRAWCPACAAAGEFTNVQDVRNHGSGRLVQLIDEGKAHSITSSDGVSLICLRSLKDQLPTDDEP